MLWTKPSSSGRPGSVAALPGRRPEDVVLSPPSPEAAEPGRLILGIVGGTIALAALVNPKLPGHAGPVDVFMGCAVFAVLLWALATHAPVRMPYGIPMAAMMITGLVAAMFSSYASQGLTAVLQEIFLLLWCAAIATVCRTPRALGVLLRAWAVSATVWGLILVVAVVGHIHVISRTGEINGSDSGGTVSGGFRAQMFFDHPNMAGNYFMIAVFIVLAAGFPRRRWLRVASCLVLVAAMFVTGSNAALGSLIGGAALTLFLRIRARRGWVRATAVAAVLAIVLGVGAVTVVGPIVNMAQQSNSSVLRDTVGRSGRSAAARQSLFAWQFKLYEEGDIIGIGPNGTQDALGAQAAPAVKEAHNDYLGTLVERGPLGLLALFGLIAVVIARLARVLRRPLPRALAEVVPMPAALAGACAAWAITAFTHEILHYRWLFTLLGLVAATYVLATRREPTDQSAERRVAGEVTGEVDMGAVPVPRSSMS